MAKKATTEPAAGQPAKEVSWHPQEASKLMQLPQELRNQIYSELFHSTRMTHVSRRSIDPSSHLALLRTCKRIHAEVGDSWLKQVEFRFDDSEAMLDTLANIPTDKLALIRHVRVASKALRILAADEGKQYLLHAALQLLPGLQLDRLTVVAGDEMVEMEYKTLDFLIKYSDGWKELNFLSPDSRLLGYKHAPPTGRFRYSRKPQPSSWQKQLEDLDGSHTNPSVAVYRAMSAGPKSSILDPGQRVPFEQNLAQGQTLHEYVYREDPALCSPGELQKEMLVIVKRGKGVDYTQRWDGVSFAGAIREHYKIATWPEIERCHIPDDEWFYCN
ncbi:hypothetical protein IWZ01DRAFT_493574 [Phyllosticta capitalensis]